MFSEYEVVVLACDISPALPKGTVGVIVMVHSVNPGAYEVELFDENDKTLAVKTLYDWQLSKHDSTVT